MYRVTRKQMIRQNSNVIEFEDSCEFLSKSTANERHLTFLNAEIFLGGRWYGPSKVIFESPSFYRSVTVTIEEVK